nr:hypothetical protein [Chlorobaculum thiosulfatiphilum]
MPTGIVSAEMAAMHEKLESGRNHGESCCQRNARDSEARFCKVCGRALE